ncbi:MAG: PDR/VanB family oxidoreductase [Mycobacterium sp.]
MPKTLQIFDEPLELVVEQRSFSVDHVVVLDLRRPEGGDLPEWTPGAHIVLRLDGDDLVREYSLCGDPSNREIWRIAVALAEDGRGGSQHVHLRLHEGTVVEVSRLTNLFRFEPSARPLFVAGGIGITPILPMIAAASHGGWDWNLLYLGKDRAHMPFTGELEALGNKVIIAESSVQGRVDLDAYVAENREAHFFVCGPEGLIAEMEDIARREQVSLSVERFIPRITEMPTFEAPFEVVVESTGQRVTVNPDQTTLEALLGAGITVPNSCGQGTCGSCETGVLAGVPDHRDSILSDDERAENDCMYVCVSRSLSRSLTLEL